MSCRKGKGMKKKKLMSMLLVATMLTGLVTGCGEKDSGTASNANAVLLHSVDVEKRDANGTALIFGFVNIDRLDTSVKALVTTEAKKALNGKVTFLK